MFEECLADLRPAAHNQVEYTGRQARTRDDVGERMRRPRDKIRRLEYDTVAVRQGGRDFPSGDRHWEIPRCHDTDDTNRLATYLDLNVRPSAGIYFAAHSERFAGTIRKELAGAGDLADPFGNRLAFFTRQEPPKARPSAAAVRRKSS